MLLEYCLICSIFQNIFLKIIINVAIGEYCYIYNECKKLFLNYFVFTTIGVIYLL